MLQEVIQAFLREGEWDKPWINAKIGQVVAVGFDQLVKIGVSVDQAFKELDSRVKRYNSRVSKVRVASFLLSRYHIPSTD